jgi:UPF0716 protein FxsA
LARFFAFGLIVLPLLEIALLIKVGQNIGLLPTLALLIGAALAGGLLLRYQGLAVLAQLRGNLSAGRMPGRTIADAMMIGVAALLLVLPGLLSDVAALALLLPPVRSWRAGPQSHRGRNGQLSPGRRSPPSRRRHDRAG